MHQFKVSEKHSGQAVVEYAGALVIATIIVAMAMSGGVDGLAGIFVDIINAVQGMLGNHVPS